MSKSILCLFNLIGHFMPFVQLNCIVIMLSIEQKIKLCEFFGNFQIITTDLDNKYIWNWIDIESLKLDKFLDEELDVMVPNTVYTKQI